MKTFYYDYNNGVTAVVSEDVLGDIKKLVEIRRHFAEREREKPFGDDCFLSNSADQGIAALGKPVFTFTRQERFRESPWFTGDTELMNALAEHLKERGDVFQRGSFYVPFSNGCECGLHGPDSMKHELAYVTTEKQFEDTFGVSIGYLVTKYAVQTAV